MTACSSSAPRTGWASGISSVDRMRSGRAYDVEEPRRPAGPCSANSSESTSACHEAAMKFS